MENKKNYTIKRIVMYIAIAAFFLFVIFSLSSCTKEGEIRRKSTKGIIINGKKYHFIEVCPADGAREVWILVPDDATVEIPQTISFTYTCGKNCTATQTAIQIKS